MSGPSDKHMETARRVLAVVEAMPSSGNAHFIAVALANAEREGMSDWNFDISQAPKGRFATAKVLAGPKGKERLVKAYLAPKIIAAGNGGVVTISKWLHEAERWEMFTKEIPPLAWMPFPDHPHSPDTLPVEADSAGEATSSSRASPAVPFPWQGRGFNPDSVG